MISYMWFLFGITGVFSNWLVGKMLEYSGGNGWSTILVIADMGIKQSPWVGMCFGLMALLMIAWRTLLERNPKFFSHISDQ